MHISALPLPHAGSLQILILYLVLINLAGFLAMGFDRRRARKHTWRTPPAVYVILCLMGGTIGCLVGMAVFYLRKRNHLVELSIPLILVVQLALILILVISSSQIRFI